MNTMQLEAYRSMYGEDDEFDALSCPKCGGTGVIKGCPKCEGEEYLDCSVCEGTGETEDGNECTKCEGSGLIDCDFCESTGEIECPLCEGEPYFEIYWNTLFEVPSYAIEDFDAAREIAWNRGWLLLESPDGDYWLAAGSCGYDFTWVRAQCLMEMCGFLPWQYVHDLSLGGDVFVSDEWAVKIAQEAYERKRAQARNLLYEARRFKEFVAKKSEKKEEK